MTDEARALNAAVGRHVRQAIQDAGSNLSVAADRAGIPYRTVLRYMSGERDMPVPVLLALVEASHADLPALMRRLQDEIRPDVPPPTGNALTVEPRQSGPATDRGSSTAVEADPVLRRAQVELDRRLRTLGVTHLAARSVGTIGAAELAAIGDVVQEIVTELRPD